MGYTVFFGLKDEPFRLTPDPDYFYQSEAHSQALESLLFAVRTREGFAQVTGSPGTGKTLLIRALLKELGQGAKTALILHPMLSPKELLRVILDDLGDNGDRGRTDSKEELLRRFRQILLEQAEKKVPTVIVIDEAQDLPEETLEELRLLSNLETEKSKLLTIILLGQLELEANLKKATLTQINERITVRCRLHPFSKQDTMAYILHRLKVAGDLGNAHISKSVLKTIYKMTEGLPRRINIICQRAMMAAFVEGAKEIKKGHVRKAVQSLSAEDVRTPERGKLAYLTLLLIILLILVFPRGEWPDLPSLRTLIPADLLTLNHSPAEKAKDPLPLDAQTDQSLQPTQTYKDLGQDQMVEPVTSVYQPATPGETVFAPPGSHFVTLDIGKREACLWAGGESGLVVKKVVPIEWYFGDGLFLLGIEKGSRPFMMSGQLKFTKEIGGAIASALWEKLGDETRYPIIPILAFSGGSLSAPVTGGRAADIADLIVSWSDAWEAKDLVRCMGFYGKTLTVFHPFGNEHPVHSWDEVFEKRKDVFSRSGEISVEVSAPLCMIDPADPARAIAIFNQRYISSIYKDDGIQVLFLNLEPQPDGREVWRIFARLWTKNPSPVGF